MKTLLILYSFFIINFPAEGNESKVVKKKSICEKYMSEDIKWSEEKHNKLLEIGPKPTTSLSQGQLQTFNNPNNPSNTIVLEDTPINSNTCTPPGIFNVLQKNNLINSTDKTGLCDLGALRKKYKFIEVEFYDLCDCLHSGKKKEDLLSKLEKEVDENYKKTYEDLVLQSMYNSLSESIYSIVDKFNDEARLNNRKYEAKEINQVISACYKEVAKIDTLTCPRITALKNKIIRDERKKEQSKHNKSLFHERFEEFKDKPFQSIAEELQKRFVSSTQLRFEGLNLSKEEMIRSHFGVLATNAYPDKSRFADDKMCLTPATADRILANKSLITSLNKIKNFNPLTLDIINNSELKKIGDIEKIKKLLSQTMKANGSWDLKQVREFIRNNEGASRFEDVNEKYTAKCTTIANDYGEFACGKTEIRSTQADLPFLLETFSEQVESDDSKIENYANGLIYYCRQERGKNKKDLKNDMKFCPVTAYRAHIYNNSFLEITNENKNIEFTRLDQYVDLNEAMCKLPNFKLISEQGFSSQKEFDDYIRENENQLTPSQIEYISATSQFLASDEAKQTNIHKVVSNDPETGKPASGTGLEQFFGRSNNSAPSNPQVATSVDNQRTPQSNINNSNTQPNFQNFGSSNYDAMASQVSSRVTEHQDKIKNADQVNSVVNSMQDALNESDSRIRDLEEQLKNKEDKAISAELAEYKRIREEMRKELERLRDDVEKRVDGNESSEIKVSEAEKKLKEYETRKTAQVNNSVNFGSAPGATGAHRSPASGLNPIGSDIGSYGTNNNNNEAFNNLNPQNFSNKAQANQNKKYQLDVKQENYLSALVKNIPEGQVYAAGYWQADNTVHVILDQDKLAGFKPADFCEKHSHQADTLHIRLAGKDHYIQKDSSVLPEDPSAAMIAAGIKECAFNGSKTPSDMAKTQEIPIQNREAASTNNVQDDPKEEKPEDDIGQMPGVYEQLKEESQKF